MGTYTFGIPPALAASLIQGLGLASAVETGTNRGHTAKLLADLVSDVWTIELSQELADQAKKEYGYLQGVHFLRGDSAEVLPTLVPELVSPTLFWLDAHWCGDGTAGIDAQCPLLEELAIVDRAPAAAESCILIDDAATFLGGPPPEWRARDFPPFIDIVDTLRSCHQRYVTVLQDVIIAVPSHGREIVERYWQEEIYRQREHERNSYGGRARRAAQRVLPGGGLRVGTTELGVVSSLKVGPLLTAGAPCG